MIESSVLYSVTHASGIVVGATLIDFPLSGAARFALAAYSVNRGCTLGSHVRSEFTLRAICVSCNIVIISHRRPKLD